MTFFSALGALPDALRGRVSAQLVVWRGDAMWVKVVQGIEDETALPIADFSTLLVAFGQAIETGMDARQAWKTSCWAHQFRGAVWPAGSAPEVVGRAMTVGQYANFVSNAGHLTTNQAEDLLRTHAGRPVPPRIERILRPAPVGRFLIWATYNQAAPATNPFATLAHTTTDVRIALGLGETGAAETLVLVAYRPIEGGAAQPLHRPTVADAAGYSYYRPHHDPLHPCGYTAPLAPNPSGLPPQPEIVHRQITGEGLLLPYHLTTP